MINSNTRQIAKLEDEQISCRDA